MRTTEQAAVRGAVVGVAVFFPAAFGASLLAGSGTAGALALAAYGSLFGGLGFGAMFGAVVHLSRVAAVDQQAELTRPVSSDERRDDDEVARIDRAA
jgi:hypothetical protein